MIQQRRNNLWLGILICTIAAFFYCYEYLLRIIPGVMEADLRVAFGNISATSFGTLSAYYYFAYTPLQLPVGLMMDRVGPRRLLIAACLLCAVGSWFFTLTYSYPLAAFGRFLVGAGSAFAFVGVLSLAVMWLPANLFSMVAGLVTSLGMLGAIVGQVGMSYLVETIGWLKVLNLGPVIGIALAGLMFFVLQDRQPKAFSLPEKKQPNGQFLKDLFKVLSNGQVWLVGFVGALLYLSLSVFAEVWGKSYLMVAHGLTNLEASSGVSMVFLGWAIGGPLLGLMADLADRRLNTLMVGSLLGCICISVLLYKPDLSSGWIYLLLFGFGFFCSSEVIIFSIAKDTCNKRLAGTVLASVNMIVMLGGAIMQPMVGKLLDSFWNGKLENMVRIYSQTDYQLVLSFLPLSLLCVAIALFFIRESSVHDDED